MSEHVLVFGFTCKACGRVLTKGEGNGAEVTLCPYCNVQSNNRFYQLFCPTLVSGHAGIYSMCRVCSKCGGTWNMTSSAGDGFFRCITCNGTGIATATCSHGQTGPHILT